MAKTWCWNTNNRIILMVQLIKITMMNAIVKFFLKGGSSVGTLALTRTM